MKKTNTFDLPVKRNSRNEITHYGTEIRGRLVWTPVPRQRSLPAGVWFVGN
jgi:hypothetical protein